MSFFDWFRSSKEQDPQAFHTPLTEKYGYNHVIPLTARVPHNFLLSEVEKFAAQRGAMLVHEQDGSLTIVDPDGAKATVYYGHPKGKRR